MSRFQGVRKIWDSHEHARVTVTKKLTSAYCESAKENMENAAHEVRYIVNPNADMNDAVVNYICIDGS